MVICALRMEQGTLQQPADGFGSITARECRWDRLCKGHGVPQDILRAGSGPLLQRFLGSSDVACCPPSKCSLKLRNALWELSGLLLNASLRTARVAGQCSWSCTRIGRISVTLVAFRICSMNAPWCCCTFHLV